MCKMFWASLGFLSVAALFPLNAQDDDLKRLNFNLGGRFSVPLCNGPQKLDRKKAFS
jgi:hypothetical protein